MYTAAIQRPLRETSLKKSKSNSALNFSLDQKHQVKLQSPRKLLLLRVKGQKKKKKKMKTPPKLLQRDIH